MLHIIIYMLLTSQGDYVWSIGPLQSEQFDNALRPNSTQNTMERRQSLATQFIWPMALYMHVHGATDKPAALHGASGCQRPPHKKCHRRTYRETNGNCNNQLHPDWGTSGEPLIRIVPNTYQDGVSKPRTLASDGSTLPSARAVSVSATNISPVKSRRFSQSVMQWGQLIAHDLTSVPKAANEDCCAAGASNSKSCIPISVAKNDPFYRGRKLCINVVRSATEKAPGCTNAAAEQVNEATHFLDASVIYGNNDKQLNDLRISLKHSARLKTSPHSRTELPLSEGDCVKLPSKSFCYKTGDDRANEQPLLAGLHQVWLIMHNHIATVLRAYNPWAPHQQVFQETRAVVNALIQKIVYEEWLPIIIGKHRLEKFKLNKREFYNHKMNPNLVNEVSSAALRFGHSLVGDIISTRAAGGEATEVNNLSDTFFNLGLKLHQRSRFIQLIRSMTVTPMDKMDNSFTKQLAGLLFRSGQPFGMDLISINVQRGRDHGIGTYSQVRNQLSKQCPDVRQVKNFYDLSKDIAPQQLEKLKKIYKSVDDIDLYAGGVSEKPVGGILGPTFGCLITEQFVRMKLGDRLFYNHQRHTILTNSQLAAIRRVTWASIACLTSDIGNVQPNAFELPRNGNKLLPCEKIPKLNLKPWKNVLPRNWHY